VKKLGELLVDGGTLSTANVRDTLGFQERFGGLFGQACVKLGFVREDDLLKALSLQLGLAIVGRETAPNPDLVLKTLAELQLSDGFARDHACLLWRAGGPGEGPEGHDTGELQDAGELHVLARNPIDPGLQEELARRFSGPIKYLLGPNRMIDAALRMLRPNADETGEDISGLQRLRQLAEDAPVIDFVNGLFNDALEIAASDIHVEPDEYGFRTRFRIDGVLGQERQHPRQIFDAVSTRIKILSLMDIAERRLPQDGRQGIRVGGEEVDLRVSSLPGAHGESIVIRLLRKKAALPDIGGLGLADERLTRFRGIVAEPNGVVLVTGPTGSGKSTTLYRAIEELNNGERKIITIEDPVEYEIPGVTQVHARSEIGLTFAAGLRSMLRQDPDVIMVGEIRDTETAEIAIQAALTGHLVLSTLHTNTAFGSIERLLDLGVEPFLIEAALKGVVGQRLVRRLCSACARDMAMSEMSAKVNERARLLCLERGEEKEARWRAPVGCPACNATGYSGRIGVFEVLDMRTYGEIVLATGLSHDARLLRLHQAGFRTMQEDAIIRAARGETAPAEVERVFGAL
jgi:general secretion pathway protein E